MQYKYVSLDMVITIHGIYIMNSMTTTKTECQKAATTPRNNKMNNIEQYNDTRNNYINILFSPQIQILCNLLTFLWVLDSSSWSGGAGG